MKPFFSVVIPLYNKENYIADTLNSVINQTFKDFEVIIIDDGSTDNSYEKVSKINDQRIKIIKQANQGLSKARNTGIKNAQAEYIAFLDADDLWMEDFLQTILNLIGLHKEHCVFATYIKLLHTKETANLLGNAFDVTHKIIISNYFKICKSILGPSSLVIKKTAFFTSGYFNESINYGEDDDFYIRCFKHYNIVYYRQPKIYYRVNVPNQLTAPSNDFNRKIPDYDKYLKDDNNKDLKKFIDFVHYRLVVLFKMEKKHELVKFYKSKIEVSNLTLVQKIKYYLPTNLFYFIKKAYLRFSIIFSYY